jgi:hypothetical protein
VLWGLNKRIAKHADHFALYSSEAFEALLETQSLEMAYEH